MTTVLEPRLIAWEVTRNCRMKCRHCRAEAADRAYPGELSTVEIKQTLENIAQASSPIIILTGGEPMIREDIYDIALHGDSLGLKMVMCPCGSLVTPDAVEKIKAARIKRISLSIDGATPASHDLFRGVHGSFSDVVTAAKNALSGKLSFQINTTITKLNIIELPQILSLAEDLGADSFHPFLLVPTGRGKELSNLELTPSEYEETLRWIFEASKRTKMTVKPTCAPHYFRIMEEAGGVVVPRHGMDGMSRGCLGGTGFAFISHIGDVQICGFLDVKCGNVRDAGYRFMEIWKGSKVFNELRDRNNYKGKCGVCEYHERCGGCRARAYARTGDYLMPEPLCEYVPGKDRSLDADILTSLQDDLPIVPRPFKEISEQVGITEEELIEKIQKWKNDGTIRHISAHIDAWALGFESALVAFEVPDIEMASKVIAEHPGVSHNYERDHKYNVWFTIKVPREKNLEDSVKKIAAKAQASDLLILPAGRCFKLDVKFDLSRSKGVRTKMPCSLKTLEHDLTEVDLLILEKLNLGLQIVSDPFREIARGTGLSEEEICRRARLLREKGIIRKFRGVVDHVKVGFKMNAMMVWDVPEDRIDEVGKHCAGKDFVSHCYERKRCDRFPYNLYTMIHAGSESTLNIYTQELSRESGVDKYVVLRTKRELMKRKITLFKKGF